MATKLKVNELKVKHTELETLSDKVLNLIWEIEALNYKYSNPLEDQLNGILAVLTDQRDTLWEQIEEA